MEKWFDLYRAIVMPAQCDIYGHMNVRHYAACFDDAGWHFPTMAGFSLEELRGRGLGTVVANLSIDFHHEIRAGAITTEEDSCSWTVNQSVPADSSSVGRYCS